MKKRSMIKEPISELDIFFSDSDEKKSMQQKVAKKVQAYISNLKGKCQKGKLNQSNSELLKEQQENMSEEGSQQLYHPSSQIKVQQFSALSQIFEQYESNSLFSSEIANIKTEKMKPKKQRKCEKIQGNEHGQRRKNGRKIRTPVSQEKIKMMELLFPYFKNKVPYKGVELNLKDIAKILNLGYSTILHKYRKFRVQGEIEKGVLVACKDIKRKYNKSMTMENYIKQAMKEKTFRTAKQLAAYIKKQFRINCNRSIVSRHLNQMQKEKFQYGTNQSYIFKNESQNQKNKTFLNIFRQIFFGLKAKFQKFYYITVIRIYYSNTQGILDSYQNLQDVQVINIVITSTQTFLLSYYPQITSKVSTSYKKSLKKSLQTTYSILYQQIQQKLFEFTQPSLTPQKRVYCIFSYDNSLKQQQIRHPLKQHMINHQINFLFMPPNINALNFIDRWFQKEIMKKIKNKTYENKETLRHELLEIMNQRQLTLCDYACEMFEKLKKL